MKTANKVSLSKKHNGIISDIVSNKYLYLMAVPVIAYYLVFCYAPMYGALIAFKQFDISKGIMGSPWVGLKYFKEFFTGIYFGRILRNTIIISLYDLLAGFPAPIIFALLLNEINNDKLKRCTQTITYLPHFISTVVVCGMIADFFSTEGIVTGVLTHLGLPKLNYVGSNDYFRHVYVWTNVWQGIGWNSIVYLAALTNIDPTLYEAAKIDGAKRGRLIWHVTLPGISSTIIVMLILRLGNIMTVGYEKIILLYGPATYETADVISSFIYRYGLGSSMQYSYSSAVGLCQSVVNLIFLTAANYISRKFTDSGIY